MQTTPQLFLPFQAQPIYAEADFLAAPSNAEALAWLGRTVSWPGGRLLLSGDAGSGKTHLLHIWSARHRAALCQGVSLPRWPAPPSTPVAVDGADAAPEDALLHLLNMAAEAGQPVLLAARPPHWPVALPDLASRLRAMPRAALGLPDALLLQTLLARLLSDRQLALPDALSGYLLARLPRHPAALRDAVARLDRAAWATGRRITRPMAMAVLAEMDRV